jgi:hypothetical protein
MIRRALLALLCMALAFGTPLLGAAAEQPCETALGIDAGAPPCDCGSGDASACALDCGIAAPVPSLLAVLDGVSPLSGSERVLAAGDPSFSSLAGPPVFQPPR